jgi:proteasome alpha subunit
MFDMSNFISPKQLLAMKQDVVEDTLSLAYPIISIKYNNGIMMLGQNPSNSLHKTSELYDRIAFAGTGVFNDYERLRKAGVHMADIKGFQYSREDVKAKTIASEYSTVLGDIFVRQHMPMEVEILVVEIGKNASDDRMYYIPFSGGLVEEENIALIGDFVKDENGIRKGLMKRFIREKNPSSSITLKEAVSLCRDAIASVRDREGLRPEKTELVALDRTITEERKFVRFNRQEIAELLSA